MATMSRPSNYLKSSPGVSPRAVCVALSVCMVLTGTAWAATPDEDHTVRLYERLAPATVSLFTTYVSNHSLTPPPTVGVGAGFILDEGGTVLTNAHVVQGATMITATLFDGQRVTAEVVGVDPLTDVAVVRLDRVRGKLSPVRLGDSSRVKVGQRVLVVGSPFGLGFSAATGIISGWAGPPGPVTGGGARLIQTTAPINPGNSGGPIVDSEGRVIGITTAMLSGAQNIGFAIPINTAKEALAELKAHGRIVRPWLGVTGTFPTEAILNLFAMPLTAGLLVADVDDGSPAAEAGLRGGTLHVSVEGVPWVLGGDILVAIQGIRIPSTQDLYEVIRKLHVGETVEIEFLRDGERHRTSAVLRERSSPPSQGPPAPAALVNGGSRPEFLARSGIVFLNY